MNQCQIPTVYVFMTTSSAPHTVKADVPARQRRRVRVRSRIAVLAACVMAVIWTLMATPAQASSPALYAGIVRNWATGVCLDAFANVNPCYDNGADGWQHWEVHQAPGSGDYYYFQNLQTYSCLDNGNGLYMWGPDNNRNCVYADPYQEWLMVGTQYQAAFMNVETNQCLDTDGHSLFASPCTWGGTQIWRWDGSM